MCLSVCQCVRMHVKMCAKGSMCCEVVSMCACTHVLTQVSLFACVSLLRAPLRHVTARFLLPSVQSDIAVATTREPSKKIVSTAGLEQRQPNPLAP